VRLCDFEAFEGDEFVAYVHRDVLAEAAAPRVIRFNFGSFGWCELSLGAKRGDE
jgi:hypothetical protein